MEDLAIRIRLEGIEQAQAQARALVDGLASATAAFAAFSAGIAAFGGLQFADEIMALSIQFEALTGSAAEAAQIMQEVQRIAQSSQFDTTEVARFAAILRSAGVAGRELSTEIEAVLNLAAALGVRRADFERFAFNLLQIRSGAGQMHDIREMLRVAPGIAAMLARAMGRERLNIDEISEMLRREGGERFFRRIIQLGLQFPGQAQRVTPLAALANFVELIQFQMLPTSMLFAKALQRMIDILSPIVRAFGWLNRLLWGIPGALIALGAAAVSAAAALRILSLSGIVASIKDLWRILVGAPALLLGGLRALRAILSGLPGRLAGLPGAIVTGIRLALSRIPIARILSLRPILGGIIPLVLSLIGEAIGGLIGRIIGNIGLGAGLGGLIGSLIPRIGTSIGAAVGGILGGLIPLVLSLIGDAIGGLVGRIISNIGLGAGLGALIGSIIPGVGTSIGAVIGGVLGGLWEPLRRLFAPSRPAQGAEERTARNTEQMARTLEAIRIQMVGGGPGAAGMRTRLESELAIRKALEGGVA